MELVYSIFLLLSAWYDLRTAKIPIWLLVLFGITGALGLLTGAWQEYSGSVSCLFAWDISASCDNLYRRGGRAGDGCFLLCQPVILALTELSCFSMRPFFCGTCSLGMAAWGIYSWY